LQHWLVANYQRIKGVDNVVSGFSGGHIENPTSELVYESNTGYAETIQINFDPEIITYRELLEIFFVMHDPTTLNRQGNDIGDEYRSMIFYHNEQQKEVAENMVSSFAAKLWGDPIVTQIVSFEKFWPASNEHQNFYNNNPNVGYCQFVINPKVQKLRQKFAEKLLPA
jgi:peptide-methionine (S)-S-oxide reductase